MKKVVLLTVLAVAFIKADAMSYEQARDQALFLTDKMAYELNLTPEQYDAAYEVNLDYLMGVTTADDVFGTYWEHRNVDLGYILLDWQYRAFMDCLWFYRPLYWDSGFWHFRIYGRYPHRDWYYFEQRTIVITYTGGGHCWRTHGSSWYCGRTFGHPDRIGSGGCGMRNNWNGQGHRYASTSQFKGSNGSNGSRDSRVEGRGTFSGSGNHSGSFSGSGNHSGSFSGSGNHSGSFSRSTDSRHQGTDVGQRVTSGRTGNTTSSEHNYSRGSSFSSGTTNSHTGSSRSSLTSNQSIREKVKSLPNVERVRVGTLSGSSRGIYSGQSSKVGSSSYSNSPRSSSSSQRSTNSLSSGRGSGRGSFSSSSSSQRSTSSLSSGRVSGRGSFSSGSFSGGRSGGGFSGGHSGGGRR